MCGKVGKQGNGNVWRAVPIGLVLTPESITGRRFILKRNNCMKNLLYLDLCWQATLPEPIESLMLSS